MAGDATKANRRSNLAIGRRLRRLRELQHLSQHEIARRVGVKAPAWNAYEKGSNAPRWQTALRIACLFGVTLEWIYTGDMSGLSLVMWRRLGGED